MGPKELLSIVPRARRRHIVGVGLAVLSAVTLVAWTIALARSIADLVQGKPAASAFLALAGFLALRVGFRFASAKVLGRSSNEIRSAVRAALRLRWGITTKNPVSTGVDSTLFGPGVDSLDDFITKYLPARYLAGIVPVLVFVTIGFLDPWTLLILIFAGPMLILLLAVIGSRTRALSEQRFRELGWLRSFYLDMVRGIPTLMVFGRATESVDTIEEISERFGRTTMSVLRTAFQTSLVIEWAATAATALVAVQVSFRMVEGKIGFAPALTALMLTPEFFAPLRTLAVEYHAGQTGNAVLAQLPDDLFSEPSRRGYSSSTSSTQPMRIAFEEVGFSYPGTDELVLRNLSFELSAGETVVVLGPSGIGKSTLIDLLLGKITPTEGQITVDGIPLAEIDRESWLRNFTSVPQQPFMFSWSIRENVALSNQDATIEEITVALKVAHASEFIDQLPLGIDSPIGEEGATLSGGQRQRLAIARALLRNAPIVVLDEFTAHLDPETELQVIASMRSFLRGRTALISAHREATISLADRVVTLSHGRLIEVPK